MKKSQALQQFWESFGIPAFDENTVPDFPGGKAPEKYITYSVSTGELGNVINLTASIWERNSTSWEFVETKAEEIAKAIEERDFSRMGINAPTIPLDNGRLYLTQGSPFAQRLADPGSDLTRRIYLNIQAEFLTAY